MHGRFSVIGGHVPGLPPKVYAYATDVLLSSYHGDKEVGIFVPEFRLWIKCGNFRQCKLVIYITNNTVSKKLRSLL